MTLVMLSPSSTVANTGSVTGAGSAHAALSDSSDSSFVEIELGEGVSLGLDDLSLPSGALLVLARIVVRAKRTPADGLPAFSSSARMDTLLSAGSFGAGQYTSVNWGLPAEASGAQIFDTALTGADVDAAVIAIGCGSQFANLVAYEAWLHVMYLVKPTVDVITPSGTIGSNVLAVEWEPTFDPDTPVGSSTYEVKIFSSAQYGAGGFNPETSTPMISSGVSVGSFNAHSFYDTWFPDGAYRAYVKVAPPSAPDHWSDWDYSAFTLDVPNPGDPTMVLTPEPQNGRVKIELDDTAGALSTEFFQVHRSVGGGEFVPVRTKLANGFGGGWVTPAGGVATIYDYEAPIGVTVTYRVRAYNSSAPASSDWVVGTTSWQSDRAWLKHPYRPSLNLGVTAREYVDASRSANQGSFRALGSENAIVVSDVRGPESGQFVFRSDDLDERDALKALLDENGSILLQVPASWEQPDRWVSIGDTASQRIYNGSWVPFHDESLPWTTVARPEGVLVE